MNRKWFLLAAVGVMMVLTVVGCALGPGNLPGQNVQAPLNSGNPPQNVQAPPNSGNPPASGQNGIPGGREGPGVQGTVTSVSGSVIQLSAQDGSTLTVNTNDQTRFQKHDAGTQADLQVNTMVLVTGTTNNGTITARTIQITPTGNNPPQGFPGQGQGNGANPPSGTPPHGGGPNALGGAFPRGGGTAGIIQSVSGNTLQLKGITGETVTVQLVDSTVIQKTESASLADIQANTQITVLGDTNGNIVTARRVEIGSVGD